MKPADPNPYVRRHLCFGWSSLFVFMTLGFGLELAHAFKLGWLLDADQETRRMMLRLAHAHGDLLGLIHIAFAASLRQLPARGARVQGAISLCLIAASLLLPGGFLLGGLVVYGGDPGPGVALAPMGALLLLVGVFLTAWSAASTSAGDSPP